MTPRRLLRPVCVPFLLVAAFVLQLLVAGVARAEADRAGTRYFVSTAGDDSASGTSETSPWRSLARVNASRFDPGDEVLFRAGDTFTGQLAVSSSGAPGRPLRFARYSEGPKPIIDGGSAPGGGYSAAILIRNRHHIEIEGLEIVNTVDRSRAGERPDWSFGIHVINDGGGVLEHFRMTGLTIRDVFAENIAHGSEDAFNRVVVSGIRFASEVRDRAGPPSYFRDIVISENLITRSGRFGVQIGHSGSSAGNRDAHSRDPETEFNQNVVIRDNRFEDLGGSAVQLAGARLALIENNDYLRTGSSVVPGRMVGRGSGAWVINSRDIVAQHNRSRSVRGYKDSYGMHVDFGNLNVLYQYNLSYDSEGGFVEVLGHNRNVIWRYNISINDGLREKDGNTIWLSPWSPDMTPSKGVHIYNNTIFVRPGLYPDLDFRGHDVQVWNNIFHASREAMIGERLRTETGDTLLELMGNLFSGRVSPRFRALDAKPVQGDPLFLKPGSTDPSDYRIDRSSPAYANGIVRAHPPFPAAGEGVLENVNEHPLTDYFGRPLPADGAPTIGAALPAGK